MKDQSHNTSSCPQCKAMGTTDHHDDYVLYDTVAHAVWNADRKVFTTTIALGTSYHSHPRAFGVWEKHRMFATTVVRLRSEVEIQAKEREERMVATVNALRGPMKCVCGNHKVAK